MAFLGNLLSAGISSGLIPNLLQGAGSVVSDIVGGLQRGEKLTPALVGSAVARGAAGTLGRILAPKPTGEQPIRVSAPLGNTAGNARPVIVQDGGIGMSRVHRPPRSGERLGHANPDVSNEDAIVFDLMSAKKYKALAKYWIENHASADAERAKAARLAMGILQEARGREGVAPGQELADLILGRSEKPKKFRNYYPETGRKPSKRERRALRG